MLDAIGGALSGAASAVSSTVSGGVKNAMLLVAERVIKEHTGKDITVEADGIPPHREEWMSKTGVNSLCCDDTWSFLDKSEGNRRKVEKWNERNIKKIVMKVDETPDPDLLDWGVCVPSWETGSDTLVLTWLPRAFNHTCNNTWLETSGWRSWWILSDEIVSGLQLYQLPGKCFYKSDWLDGFEDVDPEGFLPTSKKAFKRWFQFRHWIMFWYAKEQWGYNWQYTEKPPRLPDGSEFNLSAVLSCPSLPSLKMPNVKLPSLPGMPSMPSLPSMPSISAPSLSMPSLSMPSLSMPSLGSLPSMPERKMRPKNKWGAHGFVELEGMKVKASGKDIIFSNANITNFWETKTGSIDDEPKEHQRLVLQTTSEEQAESWKLTLMASGVEEGDVGGCCVVA